MEKLITVTYGFDNLSEFPFFDKSIYTLTKKNNDFTKYKVLIIVKDNEIKEFVNKYILESYEGLDFEIRIPSDLKDIKKVGKFYWLLSPFYTDTMYTLQLDNDTLINTKIEYIIKNALRNDEKAPIWGVRISVKPTWSTVQSITGRENFEYDLNYIDRWINAGVVLINNNEYKKSIKTYDMATMLLNDFFDDESHPPTGNIKRTLSDEAFIYLYFGKNLSNIKRRFNLRVQTFKTTKKWVNNNNTIFHYNLRRKENNKYLKFDFEEILKKRKFGIKDIKKMKKFINIMKKADSVDGLDQYVNDIANFFNKILK